MKLTQVDHTGKKLEELLVSDALFDAKVNESLMAQAIRVYQDRLHQHTHKVKGRGEINMTTAKWFKQKGTGRARHGAQSAPIFVGGGVAHGPTGVRASGKVLPLKMKRLSILGALTQKAKDNKILVVTGLDQITAKTSNLSKLLKTLELKKKVLVLTAKAYENLLKASSNIKDLKAVNYQQVNIVQVLRSHHLLIDDQALPSLEAWLVSKKAVAKPETAKPKAKTTKKTK